MTQIKNFVGYENLTREELIKVAIGLRDRNQKTQNELNILKNNIRAWERTNAENVKRDLEDIIEPSQFKCFHCETYISPVKATQIFKGRPYCIDCLHAKEAENKHGLKTETRKILDYSGKSDNLLNKNSI